MKLITFMRKYIGWGTVGLALDIFGALMIGLSLKITKIPGHYHASTETGELPMAYISRSSNCLWYGGFSFLLLGFFLLIVNEIKNRRLISKIHSRLDNKG